MASAVTGSSTQAHSSRVSTSVSGVLRGRLVLASALMLFVELVLIRWLGANILHLSYFSNFVLLGSFLGIGLGFLRSGHSRDLTRWWPILLALLVAFVSAFPVQVDQNSDQIIYFTAVKPTGLPAWVTLPLVFLATAAILAGLGETVGRLFPQFPALEAYRLDLLGSILGTVTFSVLSYLGSPPLLWALVITAGYVVLNWRSVPRLVIPALVLVVVLLGIESFQPGLSWSPYYKIQTTTTNGNTVAVSVNGIPHQTILDVTRGSRGGLRQDPFKRLRSPVHKELIIGAGTGNDVAIGLAHGVGSIDAVEIDPGILAIGKARNSNHPYNDPRAHPHVTDGRAFLQRTATRYDLIVLALPDSLTLISGQSSLRLESYLFTVQAIQSARQHLAPGGGFAMYNSYRQRWLIDRYAGTLAQVFGHRPCIDTQRAAATRAALTVADNPADQQCATTWAPATQLVAPATDDHPFPYLKSRGIPSYYLWVLGAMLLVALVAVRAVGGSLRRMRPYADLFCMGAAFLLLETKNVTGFALLFGTTWLVNALVFVGVLVAVLLAVEVSARLTRMPPPTVRYAVLAVTLLIAWLVPVQPLLSLPFLLRLAAAAALAFAPIFCANVIFAARFKATGGSTAAFGANLLGALLGGTLEYVSLVIGYQALLIVAALLYFAAFVLTPQGSTTALA